MTNAKLHKILNNQNQASIAIWSAFVVERRAWQAARLTETVSIPGRSEGSREATFRYNQRISPYLTKNHQKTWHKPLLAMKMRVLVAIGQIDEVSFG
jgi:hypothetical protein